ncbi:MAG: hypothetical protein E2591_16725 [Achromobacter sp.]|uniref:hypothetical protein n=1 Tax=Achromobacter sp. TaxID=134375 RepID=UPI0012CC31DE|nr:hypothetical protein [Achromobacter sp.]MPS79711.1 hypothetical protein [Achromobacter sp.]
MHRYWETNDNGKYRESAKALLADTRTTNAAQQTALLRTYATAHDTDRRFQCCGKPVEVKSRTSHLSFSRVCVSCDAERKEEALVIANRERDKHNQMLQHLAQRNANKKFDYLNAPDDIAILVLALNRALGGRYFQITFQSELCSSLCSAYHQDFLTRLFDEGVLVHNPLKAPSDAYEFAGDTIHHHYERVVFEAAPSVLDDIEVISHLENRAFTNGAALCSLWLEYATDECMAYFLDQTSQHGMQTSENENALIVNTLRSALHRYSIAQLWNGLWQVVKRAAELSTRQYFNSRRAASTIPKAFRTHLELVDAGQRRLYEWWRPHGQPKPTLGQIFWDRWSIDDKTPGQEVIRLFAQFREPSHPTSLTYTREEISQLLRQILALDVAPEALTTFAEAISAGDSMDLALRAVAVGHDLVLDDDSA